MSRLLRALDTLEMEFALPRETVHRTEIGKDGRLVLHAESPSGARWFVEADRALVELRPPEERSLPGLAPFLASGTPHGVVGWRPARRLVAGGDDEPRRALKFFRRGQRDAARTAHERAASAAEGAFRVPRLIPCEYADALQFEWISDAAELDYGMQAERFLAIGRGLARLQTHRDLGGIPVHGRAEELAVLTRWADRYRAVQDGLPPGWSALANELALRSTTTSELVPAHRDLHDGQFLFSDDSVVVLDFDLFAHSERELDLANLAAHAELAALQGSRGASAAGAARFVQGLVAGYRAGGRVPSTEAWRFWSAAALLRLALVHGLRPGSFHQRAPLIELARRALVATPPIP